MKYSGGLRADASCLYVESFLIILSYSNVDLKHTTEIIKTELDYPVSLIIINVDKGIDRGIDEAHIAVEMKYKRR